MAHSVGGEPTGDVKNNVKCKNVLVEHTKSILLKC